VAQGSEGVQQEERGDVCFVTVDDHAAKFKRMISTELLEVVMIHPNFVQSFWQPERRKNLCISSRNVWARRSEY
jgi:hypothetical protein